MPSGADIWKILLKPRIGWLSALGLATMALLALAIHQYANGAMSGIVFVGACVLNYAGLAFDHQRNK